MTRKATTDALTDAERLAIAPIIRRHLRTGKPLDIKSIKAKPMMLRRLTEEQLMKCIRSEVQMARTNFNHQQRVKAASKRMAVDLCAFQDQAQILKRRLLEEQQAKVEVQRKVDEEKQAALKAHHKAEEERKAKLAAEENVEEVKKAALEAQLRLDIERQARIEAQQRMEKEEKERIALMHDFVVNTKKMQYSVKEADSKLEAMNQGMAAERAALKLSLIHI
jgi:hypothetical protein